MILEVNNLCKSFLGVNVLSGLSFSLAEGEVLAIIGSSGSGKSTLLRILCSLEKMDGGSVLVAGRPLDKQTAKDVGMIFQSFNLFPHLSVEGNITLALRKVQKKSKAEATEICARYLDLVGLSGSQKKYPCQLSGGMQQRTAIARALALEPRLLCFDEPTSALDPELTYEVLKVIKNLKNLGRTMIIVTHEMSFARDVADKIMFLDDGIIEEYGDANEVYNSPKSPRLRDFLKRVGGE